MRLLLAGVLSTVSVFGSSFIQPDSTIQIGDYCIFKKYIGYTVGDEIWLTKNCDASNANALKAGKYQWSYDSATGQIKNNRIY